MPDEYGVEIPSLLVTDTYACESRHEKFHVSLRCDPLMPRSWIEAYLHDGMLRMTCPVTGEHFTPDQRVYRAWRELT